MDGLMVVDKPGGMTSRDALDRVAKWFPRKTKIGHTGTLDPLATGVLVVTIGRATRLGDIIQAMGKSYRTTIRLGATSDTDDADGTISPYPDAVIPNEELIRNELLKFLGRFDQIPPNYSAIKVEGRRAHKSARKGQELELKPRSVRVDAIELERFDWPELQLKIDCGKGTYIRSIARDLGSALGCGGYVRELRRVRVGSFSTEEAVALDSSYDQAHARLLPMGRAVEHLPGQVITAEQAVQLRQGRNQPTELETDLPIAIWLPDRQLIGLGEVRKGHLAPAVILDRWAV